MEEEITEQEIEAQIVMLRAAPFVRDDASDEALRTILEALWQDPDRRHAFHERFMAAVEEYGPEYTAWVDAELQEVLEQERGRELDEEYLTLKTMARIKEQTRDEPSWREPLAIAHRGNGLSLTIIDHRPDKTEIEVVLWTMEPYQSMFLFDWQPRGFIPSNPSLLGWVQREVVANGDQDFWTGSHNISDYQGYVSMTDAVKLVQELEPNYVLYGYSS